MQTKESLSLIHNYFSDKEKHPYDQIEWEKRDIEIKDSDGKVIFTQKDVEVPAKWSDRASNIVASKYFYGKFGTPERETSVKQMIDRVIDTISGYAEKDGLLTKHQSETFNRELKYLLVNQYCSFNSPVWFNVGTPKKEKPQSSACFILGMEDNMESILQTAFDEGMIFKYGSGSGTNYSKLRSKDEPLSDGGSSSGAVSFMKMHDAVEGTIKSGGNKRRAAKMNTLDDTHPDLEEFINCKSDNELIVQDLVKLGYSSHFEGTAYDTVRHQNANHSVRLSDEFMEQVEKDGVWHTYNVGDVKEAKTYQARWILKQIAKATHICGDPGIQFKTTINNWHTCSNTAPINASNPCVEFMFLDDTACNLASINLLKFLKEDGSFDIQSFLIAVSINIVAQEALVNNSSYPTKKITENSRKYRPLGLGYANLGALLMTMGLAYDSTEGRAVAALITSMLTAQAYRTSSWIAEVVGSFPGYEKNKEPMKKVLNLHKWSMIKLNQKIQNMDSSVSNSVTGKFSGIPDKPIGDWLVSQWEHVCGFDSFRNAQVTLLAPTGTIAFMMDCDTTGIEIDYCLRKKKKLVGGGSIVYENNQIKSALKSLGYTEESIEYIMKHFDRNGTIEGCDIISPYDLPVFDTAVPSGNGKRFMSPEGHIKMVGAVQPFLSGAVSKTVNVPYNTTIQEIYDLYILAWKRGLKAVAIYRDGSKASQPLNNSINKSGLKDTVKKVSDKELVSNNGSHPKRTKLPQTRNAINHKFTINGHEGYINVGLYPDGKPGELFITMAKEGSTIAGLMDSLATSVSIAWQYGVPLNVLAEKFIGSKFEPAGFTSNEDIRNASSPVDYVFKWLNKMFVDNKQNPTPISEKPEVVIPANECPPSTGAVFMSNPPCRNCGEITRRDGTCYSCENCGASTGCTG